MTTRIRPLSMQSILIVTVLSVIASVGTFAAGKSTQGAAPPERVAKTMNNG